MEIKIIENKEKTKFMDLLLLGDEQEDMIYKYLERGELFALYDDDLKSVAVVTKEKENVYELKNLATYQKYQGNGYGSFIIKYIKNYYKNVCRELYVGTGENEKISMFYKRNGFEYSHTINDFFVKNYDHKIVEDGKELKDMIYLKMEIK
jgi:GNAT superfamily N-acetyltransferase